MNKIKGGGDKGEWMNPMVRQALQLKWNEDEYKKKSEQNKKSRASETGGSVHTCGFIPFTERRRRMVINFDLNVNFIKLM